MTTTPVNTTATTQASPFGGGTKSAGAGGSKNGGADFLSFLDQLFGSTTASGPAQTGGASSKAAGETAANETNGETGDLPPWLLAFAETEASGTTDLPATDNTTAETATPENPIDTAGGDGSEANALLAGTVDPTLTPPPVQPPAQPDTSGQTVAAQPAVETPSLPVTDKTVAATVAATELAVQANAKSSKAEASAEPAAPAPTQATAETTGDPEIDGILATLARRQAQQSTQGTQQAAATGSEAEQLARAANPAAQVGEGQPRDGKTEKTRSPLNSNKADQAASPENRGSDALSRLLAAAQQNRGGAATGDSAGNPDAQAFKPAASAPVLLTINEVGSGTTAMTATATQALAATATAQIAQTARPNMETLAVRIAQSAGAGTKSFEIELDPPELGRVEVRLEFSRDGRVSTHLTVDRSDTLDALMRDARGLERALQAQGLKLEDGGVQYQLRDQSSFAQQQGGRDAPEQSETSGVHDDKDTAPATETGQPVTRHIALGGLDLRI